MEWSKESHEMQYLGKSRPYVSARRFPNGVEIAIWTKGCGFNPQKTWHESMDSAKKYGERIAEELGTGEKEGFSMERCPNKVTQFIAQGYGYKEVSLPCGSTGVLGQQLLCNECIMRAEQEFPQGWRHVPGDICKHGRYIGDDNDPDYLCPECEMEDEALEK